MTARSPDVSPAEHAQPADDVALVDDWTVRSRAEVERSLDAAGRALLALCPEPGARVGVIGENRAETLLAHAAAIRVGVGTVALAKTLSTREIVDQCLDAGVVAVVTGPSALPAVLDAVQDAGLLRVVLCGAPVPAGLPALVESWDDWLERAPAADRADHRVTTGRPTPRLHLRHDRPRARHPCPMGHARRHRRRVPRTAHDRLQRPVRTAPRRRTPAAQRATDRRAEPAGWLPGRDPGQVRR